jgi:hypothetical protein
MDGKCIPPNLRLTGKDVHASPRPPDPFFEFFSFSAPVFVKFFKVLYSLFWSSERGFLSFLGLEWGVNGNKSMKTQVYLSEELLRGDLKRVGSEVECKFLAGTDLDGRRSAVFYSGMRPLMRKERIERRVPRCSAVLHNCERLGQVIWQ